MSGEVFHVRRGILRSKLISACMHGYGIESTLVSLSSFSSLLQTGDTQTGTVDDSRDFLIPSGHIVVTRLPCVLSVTCDSVL